MTSYYLDITIISYFIYIPLRMTQKRYFYYKILPCACIIYVFGVGYLSCDVNSFISAFYGELNSL